MSFRLFLLVALVVQRSLSAAAAQSACSDPRLLIGVDSDDVTSLSASCVKVNHRFAASSLLQTKTKDGRYNESRMGNLANDSDTAMALQTNKTEDAFGLAAITPRTLPTNKTEVRVEQNSTRSGFYDHMQHGGRHHSQMHLSSRSLLGYHEVGGAGSQLPDSVWVDDVRDNLTFSDSVTHDVVNKEDPLEVVNRFAKTVVVPSTFILALTLIVSHLINSCQLTSKIPESAVTIAMSMLFGVAIRFALIRGVISLEGFEILDASVLNLALLPIIMFDAGWSIKVVKFAEEFESILIYATLGTIVTASVIGYSSFQMYLSGWHSLRGLRENMIFGALIAATDPVATLATFRKLDIARVQPLLNTLVMGESLLNDAIAIIWFEALNTPGVESFGGMAFGMAKLLLGSVALGVLTASAFVLVLRFTGLGVKHRAVLHYILISAYFTYALAQACGLSGIVSNLFAGMIFKLYGAKHLEQSFEKAAGSFFDNLTSLAETGIFIICGTACALISSDVDWHFAVVAVFLVLFARGVATIFCSLIANAIKMARDANAQLISVPHQVMIWHSGLRGGIALVLSIQIGGWCEFQQKSTIVCATLIVVCLLLLACGTTTELFLHGLGLMDEFGRSETEENEALRKGGSALTLVHGVLKSLLVGPRQSKDAAEQLGSDASSGGSAQLAPGRPIERVPSYH